MLMIVSEVKATAQRSVYRGTAIRVLFLCRIYTLIGSRGRTRIQSHVTGWWFQRIGVGQRNLAWKQFNYCELPKICIDYPVDNIRQIGYLG